MSDKMALFFLGPIPPQEFLSAFLLSSQPSRFKAGMLDTFASSPTEAAMYRIFVHNHIPLPEVFWH
jgi:hypothetical protein